jgi:ribosomal protein S8
MISSNSSWFLEKNLSKWSNLTYQKSFVLLSKTRTKQLFCFDSFLAQFKTTILKGDAVCVYYHNPFFEKFAKMLRYSGFITSYTVLPLQDLLFVVQKPIKHFSKILSIHLQPRTVQLFQQLVHSFSQPSRMIYLNYTQLVYLNNKKTAGTLYVISTTKGLLFSDQAIKLKIGGLLLCRFN